MNETKVEQQLLAANNYIEKQKDYISDLENEINLLYSRLSLIRELTNKSLIE